MKTLKEAAPGEIDAVRKRALRSFAMGRIGKLDCDAVVSKCDELDTLVQGIDEHDPEGIAR